MKRILAIATLLLISGCSESGTGTVREQDMVRQRGPIPPEGARWPNNQEPWQDDRKIHMEGGDPRPPEW